MPTGDPMEICKHFLNNLDSDFGKEQQAEAKLEVASSESQHSPHCARSLNVLPKKTRQLLKK